MARRKKPENETVEQTTIRRAIETIADNATRNEKVSWDRKMDNMVKLMAKLRPIEDQIVELVITKQPLFDEITALRADMVKDCIHPSSHLVHQTHDQLGDYIICKFCNKWFSISEEGNG